MNFDKLKPYFFIFLTFTDIDFYQWDIDFYPRGIRYGKAQIINVYNLPGSLEIPEVLLKTVRLSVTCKSNLEVDQRFMVSRHKIKSILNLQLLTFALISDWGLDHRYSKRYQACAHCKRLHVIFFEIKSNTQYRQLTSVRRIGAEHNQTESTSYWKRSQFIKSSSHYCSDGCIHLLRYNSIRIQIAFLLDIYNFDFALRSRILNHLIVLILPLYPYAIVFFIF